MLREETYVVFKLRKPPLAKGYLFFQVNKHKNNAQSLRNEQSGIPVFWTLSFVWYSKEHTDTKTGTVSVLTREVGDTVFWVR
jgi:hypothetical protein